MLAKYTKTYPDQADYSCPEVVISSYIAEQNSVELGKDQLLVNMNQTDFLDATNSLKEIPETAMSWGTHLCMNKKGCP